MENGKKEKPDASNAKVSDFKDLRAWQEARKLRVEIYRLTQSFPKEEAYGLTSQMRRAAVSTTANLAEGYGRFSYQENVQFCRHSRASVYELRDHFTTALDANYISEVQFAELEKQAMDVILLLNGYIRSTQRLQKEKINE
jgi:four helix bundle protein